MNNQKPARWGLTFLLAAVLIGAVLLAPVLSGAEKNPPEEKLPATEAGQPQNVPPVSETGSPKQQETDQQPQAAIDTPARPVEPFNPSEAIGADSAVSFPVDI